MNPEFDIDDGSKVFLLEAIKDAQAIIRALDFKANALLVVMALLLANVNKIAAAAGFLTRRHGFVETLAVGGGIACLLTGALAAWFAVLTLAARFDPRAAIDSGESGDKPFLGAFFAGGLFAFKPAKLMIGRFDVARPASLDAYVKRLPTTAADVVTTLAFEQLKVANIRDSKAATLALAYRFGVAALAIVAAIWIVGLMLGSDLP